MVFKPTCVIDTVQIPLHTSCCLDIQLWRHIGKRYAWLYLLDASLIATAVLSAAAASAKAEKKDNII